MGATEPVRARFVVGRWRWHWVGCVGRYEGLEKPSPFFTIILSGIASSFSLHSSACTYIHCTTMNPSRSL